jgi:hypothetical protein
VLTRLKNGIRLRTSIRIAVMNIVGKSLFLLIVLILAGPLMGQGKSDSAVIETSVAKLQQKVLLSDKQAADIKTLLNRNAGSIKNEATRNKTVSDSKSRIEALLDIRQKAKYSIIENDWWNNLVRDLDQR